VPFQTITVLQAGSTQTRNQDPSIVVQHCCKSCVQATITISSIDSFNFTQTTRATTCVTNPSQTYDTILEVLVSKQMSQTVVSKVLKTQDPLVRLSAKALHFLIFCIIHTNSNPRPEKVSSSSSTWKLP
jgi:hypothetical protein